MSGIVGILRIDQAPIDRESLRRMTAFLTFRGSDEQEVWCEGNVGLGHAMLRTTWEAETEKQPLTLDGRVWLTADARIDGRDDLILKLRAKLGKELVRASEKKLPSGNGKNPQEPAALNQKLNDAELILLSYHAWGADCVKYLLGDFAFAVWDGPEQRLFCARDHLGVRQFYYALTNGHFIFSNTLNCLRSHAEVSSKLNELAIGDFLLFGLNQEPTTTTFAEIQRLAPAHFLSLSGKAIEVGQYWTPSVGSIKYKTSSEYIETFLHLLRVSVVDRLRTGRVGISMSGGIDSSAVAATAMQRAQNGMSSFDLTAFCVLYDRVFEDRERKYASQVADALGIRLDFLDGHEINKGDSPRSLGVAPEPFNVDPFYVATDELLRRIATEDRVALTGWDGDAFLSETPKYNFVHCLKKGDLWTLAEDLLRYMFHRHALPPVGVRTTLKRLRHPRSQPPFPAWLKRNFSKRLNLVERWERVMKEAPLPHPIRPYAFRIMSSPDWSALFAGFDANVTSLPLEVRHPLIDIRLVEYLLSVPIIPWLLDKTILRAAMTGLLPEAVRVRPKSPLTGDPGLQLTGSKKFSQIDSFTPAPALLDFIDREAIPSILAESDSNKLWVNVRPFSLNQWLVNSLALDSSLVREDQNVSKV
ncbi:lasso peptide isopeptide bond-forming cyclase [soil metagenome]